MMTRGPARALLTCAVLATSARGAFAQGCAMCKTAAESSSSPGAINRAILVLLFPTLAIFAGIVYRAYRHR